METRIFKVENLGKYISDIVSLGHIEKCQECGGQIKPNLGLSSVCSECNIRYVPEEVEVVKHNG